jgi:hypothetical protein
VLIELNYDETAWQVETTGEKALNQAPWGNTVIKEPQQWN